MVIYGPDHKIIQVKSPEEATSANLLRDADEGGDEVEEVLPQSQEEQTATIRRKNEARRESIVASIQLPVWMTGLTRINKFEVVYAQCPMDRMTTVEGLKEKVWMWLTRDQEVVLSKGSVSADTLDEAVEASGIASMPKLNDMETKQKIIHSEVHRLIAALAKEHPIMSSSTQPVVAESALIPSPTQDPTVGGVQPMVIDQDQTVAQRNRSHHGRSGEPPRSANVCTPHQVQKGDHNPASSASSANRTAEGRKDTDTARAGNSDRGRRQSGPVRWECPDDGPAAS